MYVNINNTKKLNIDSNTLLILYRHYKAYLLPLAVILSCIVILFLIVIPQVQQYFASQDQLKVEQEKLNILKNNYNYLSSLDDAKLDNDLKSLSSVLPSNKDFAGIMNAIALVSAKTGVSVGNFEFSIGDLAKPDQGASAYPSIKIDMNLAGTTASITMFVAELYKTAPLAEVTSIKTSGNLSALIILFYYKPFPPENISGEVPIIPYSAQSLSLIHNMSTWNNATVESFLPFISSIPTSSSESSTFSSSVSAGSNPSPF